MATLNSLHAITPIDGRYHEKTQLLSSYFSEAAFITTRVEVELRYLVALSEFGILRTLSDEEKSELQKLYKLSDEQLERVKELEKTTRHDVKAIEYFLREVLNNTSLKDVLEMLHFGLTSEDVNNLAYGLMLKRSVQDVFVPQLKKLIATISQKAESTKFLPMLARTHGQPAIPTTLGKELIIFAVRLHKELKQLEHVNYSGKLNGAVGNLSALSFAYPDKDWIGFSRQFIQSLGLSPSLYTTQVNTPEEIISMLQIFSRVNGILLDFDQDMWRYISDGWLIQENKKGEIGSSTMPQKINPIDFENSEGNCKLGNSILDGIIHSLASSRLQRDLSGSTIYRNIGTALSYTFLALTSTLTGLEKVSPDQEAMKEALDSNWAILSEAVQTILRKHGTADAYDKLLELSRGKELSQDEWSNILSELPIDEVVKKELQQLTPENYLGLATKLTEMAIKEIQA